MDLFLVCQEIHRIYHTFFIFPSFHQTFAIPFPLAQVGVLRVPVLQPILSVNEDPEGQYAQGGGVAPSSRPPATKPPKRLRYYARLYVNGRLLDSSEDSPLDEDFVTLFKDTFRWVTLCPCFLNHGFIPSAH